MRKRQLLTIPAITIVVAAALTVIGQSPSALGAVSQGQAIVNAAAAEAGTPYCYGGGSTAGPTHGSGGSGCPAGTAGFDCSGLALYAVHLATGITLPHNAGEQATYGGTVISSQSSLEPGDLVFFGGGSMANAEHVGIYAGNGEMWDANDYNVPVQEHSLQWEEAGLAFDGGVRYWSGAAGGGGSAGSALVRAVATSDGDVQLFEVSNGAIEENWYSPATGAIGNWVSPGAMQNGAQAAGDPAVVPRAGQQVIDAFVRSTDGQIRETWYNWGTGQWGGWIVVSGSTFTGDPQVVATSDGNDQVFADNNGVIEENWFTPATGAIGNWVSPGAMQNGAQAAGDPAVVPRPGQQVIDAFVRSTDGQIRETWYNWGTGQWGGWIVVSGSTFTGDPQAVATSDGNDQVFADNNGVIEENWFTPATGAIGNWVAI